MMFSRFVKAENGNLRPQKEFGEIDTYPTYCNDHT
jgi:hypothetical protein